MSIQGGAPCAQHPGIGHWPASASRPAFPWLDCPAAVASCVTDTPPEHPWRSILVLWAESRMPAWLQDSRRLAVPTGLAHRAGRRRPWGQLPSSWATPGAPLLSQGCVGAGLPGAGCCSQALTGPRPRAPGLRSLQVSGQQRGGEAENRSARDSALGPRAECRPHPSPSGRRRQH